MKRALIGLLGSVAITIATLCVLEGVASTYLFARDYHSASAPRGVVRPHTTHDTLLGWTNRPGFASPDEYGPGIGLTTTALGARAGGASDSLAATPGKGLVCSGDSYTLGYGVSDEHAWCALLAGALHRHGYNMGEVDYGLDQSALRYERDGGRLAHQVQVLGITNAELERMTTTRYEGLNKPELSLDHGKVVALGVPVPEQTGDALREASRDRLKYGLRGVQAFTQLTGVDARVKAARRIDEQWALAERVLDDLAAANATNGSRLELVYLPVKRDLRPNSPDGRRKKLASYAQRRGISFVDLTAAMRHMRPDSLDLSFISRVPRGAAPRVTDQYSDLGNAWVARTLATRLRADSL